MSPRPLTDFPGAESTVVVGSGSPALVNPEVAALCMQLIAVGSYIDTIRSNIVTAMLDADYVLVSVMLDGFNARSVDQMAKAALKHKDPEDAGLIRDVWAEFVKPVEDFRDIFAHRLWAHSTDPRLLNDLILVEPGAEQRRYARGREFIASFKLTLDNVPTYEQELDKINFVDPTRADVYTAGEMKELVTHALQAFEHARSTWLLTMIGPSAVGLRSLLQTALRGPQRPPSPSRRRS